MPSRFASCLFRLFLAVSSFSFFLVCTFSSYISFPHFSMAVVFEDTDVAFHDADDLLVGDGRGPITARARPLTAWIALVRALLPKHASMVKISLREQIPVRTLQRWKALASKNSVDECDSSAVRNFVLKQKGMRLDPHRSRFHRLCDVDQLRLFRQVLQPGAPLQSLAAVMKVSRSRLVRMRSKCIDQNVDRDNAYSLRVFLKANGILCGGRGALRSKGQPGGLGGRGGALR